MGAVGVRANRARQQQKQQGYDLAAKGAKNITPNQTTVKPNTTAGSLKHQSSRYDPGVDYVYKAVYASDRNRAKLALYDMIAQGKKLKRQKELQKKRKDAKSKMQDKTKEMETLVKARLSDFKKKATDQSKKLQKNEVEPTGDTIAEGQDVVQVALDVATSELDPASTVSYAKIQFADGGVQNLDNFSAKRIAATYAQLDDTHKQQFQYMLNKDAGTYQSALDFAIRNN